MIKKVKVISKLDLKQYWSHLTDHQFLEQIGCKKMAFIAVFSTTNEPHQIPDCRSLTLTFDDLIIDTSWGTTPNTDHIELIAEFIQQVHLDPEEYLLVCQCDGGSSRSGAAGEYAVKIAGLDHQRFMRENPRVLPNTLMQQLFAEIEGHQ